MHLPHSVGLQKTTLIDYPGKVASVLFFPGCNMRCSYCHNPDLVLGRTEGLINRDEVIQFLNNRAPLLGGVVLSGGEPLLYRDLKYFISEIRENGDFSIKLDTNGLRFDSLKELLESKNPPDFIAMDIKSALSSYDRFFIDQNEIKNIQKSIDLILDSKIPSQFRTTVHPDFIDVSMIDEIAHMIRGCTSYVLNGFRPGNCLEPSFNSHQETSSQFLKDLQKGMLDQDIPCTININ
ncbi:anaerobic ribonucleoside-triphosphate reductase activating protein [Oceanispirochaeta crateris]|uniref:Anaerobic ribonucleoside-triphosphate reductase activating protein n=1 Tax=Oceanispirochaeta crateris TaxID=2518645 RepID=A0A5C1QLF0_9SPIO|nr:anaerobic ribonucleoside-triphosphate reductase activating protein [Oceanispirochaeta crateris]QEN07356.1 anaerobic ribonucleoside-triphosphate reductase activating protein [Oceanispirochaeta crateris]